MSTEILMMAVLAAVVIVGAAVATAQTRSSKATRTKRGAQASEEDYSGFPYQRQRQFLSPAEMNFYRASRSWVGRRAVVCVKVGLGDVFSVVERDASRARGYRNKIDRKHVDFLLCDPTTMQPLAGVELDDSSHSRPDRQVRDAFVDGVFGAAGLPLVHVTPQRAYTPAELEAQVGRYLPQAVIPRHPSQTQ